jgi:hypothetical protein
VGSVNGASGVYLGNCWVLTAGHVGIGDFVLSGTYSAVAGSEKTITDANGLADFSLFQISSSPALPDLAIASATPVPFSSSDAGTPVVMLGYGGGQGKTWGMNTVTDVNLLVQIDGLPFTTVDFETQLGTITAGFSSVTNLTQLVSGDSGGGDFYYDASTGSWKLAGINEAIDEFSNSYMVDLSNYTSRIYDITGVPEPTTWVLIGMGGILFLVRGRKGICWKSQSA